MLVEEYYDFEKEGIYRRGCEIKNVLPMIGSKSNFFSSEKSYSNVSAIFSNGLYKTEASFKTHSFFEILYVR